MASEGANAQFVAKNLVNLVNESKAGELASLEELVSSLVKDMLDKDNKDAALDPEVCIWSDFYCVWYDRHRDAGEETGEGVLIAWPSP